MLVLKITFNYEQFILCNPAPLSTNLRSVHKTYPINLSSELSESLPITLERRTFAYNLRLYLLLLSPPLSTSTSIYSDTSWQFSSPSFSISCSYFLILFQFHFSPLHLTPLLYLLLLPPPQFVPTIKLKFSPPSTRPHLIFLPICRKHFYVFVSICTTNPDHFFSPFYYSFHGSSFFYVSWVLMRICLYSWTYRCTYCQATCTNSFLFLPFYNR